MQKGLDRIGLEDVEWRKFLGWFNDWITPLATFLVVTMVLEPGPFDALTMALCIFGAVSLVRAGKALFGPWLCKPASEPESAKSKKDIPDY